MTFGDFKELVASFMQREASSYVSGTTNALEFAINQARKWAERQHNFFYAQVTVLLQDVDVYEGGLLSGAILLEDEEEETPESVNVKFVHKAFLPFTGTSPRQWYPVDIRSRVSLIEQTQRLYTGTTTPQPKLYTTKNTVTNVKWCVYQYDGRIWLHPPNADLLGAQTTDVALDVTRWMPDYTEDSDEDFFLVDCADFMLMRTIYQLNLFLKEDQRVALDANVMNEMWNAIKMWNNSIVSTTTNENNFD